MTTVHLAASGGHLSLLREIVDTHHANVHQTTKVCLRLLSSGSLLPHAFNGQFMLKS